jgi:hypothetical protein
MCEQVAGIRPTFQRLWMGYSSLTRAWYCRGIVIWEKDLVYLSPLPRTRHLHFRLLPALQLLLLSLSEAIQNAVIFARLTWRIILDMNVP